MRALVPLLAGMLACASNQARPADEHLPSRQPACRGAAAHRRLQGIALLEQDPSLTQGRAGTDAILLDATIVNVANKHFDIGRIDPARMLDAMLDAIVSRSEGRLRRQGRGLVTSSGELWSAPKTDTVWQIPAAVRGLEEFLVDRLPSDHRLARGSYAEVMMTNALLSTLDCDSMLLTIDANRAIHGEPSPLADAMRTIAPPPPAPHVTGGGNFRLHNLGGGIKYLQILSFSGTTRDTWDFVARAVEDRPAGLIVDLRGTSKGPLIAAVELADVFLSSGTIVTMRSATPEQSKSARAEGSPAEQVKLAVLVDETTRGSMEIVAGSLRFGDRAIVIGEPTAGVATIGKFYDLNGPSGDRAAVLYLAVAEAVLAGDHRFDGVGISPDLLVGPPPTGPWASPAPLRPAGDNVGAVDSDDRDAPVRIAAQILARSPSASRSDLLAVARALAAERMAAASHQRP